MKLRKDNELVITFNPITQAELIEKGYKVVEPDTEPHPTQADIEVADEYTIRKKPVKHS